MGYYLAACLAFVVFALAEFAVSILIHRMKSSKLENEKEKSKDVQKKNDSLIMSQKEKTTGTVATAWMSDTYTIESIAESHCFKKLLTEIRRRMSMISLTCGIDFIAAWIHFMAFVVMLR